ncbi:InlB B-repeat-containing protein, partial [Candidatus Saccharibacteria bacterium]|nr:InlB B-repeat-containing protein [Candidatus Saccharibacteria bacterium]
MSSHSALQISNSKRFFAHLSRFFGQYKYFLIVGVLALTAPIVASLTFAEDGELVESTGVSEVQDVEDGKEEAGENDEEGDVVDAVDEDDDVENDESDIEGESETKEDGDEDIEEGEDGEAEEEGEDEPDEGEGSDAQETDANWEEDWKKIEDAVIAASPFGSQKVGGRIYSDNVFKNHGYDSFRETVIRNSTDLPSYYNSRDERFGSNISIKNQNTEGLCWLYSPSSVIEFYIAKNGLANTGDRAVSPKHIDYQMVDGSIAYNESGKSNLIYDRVIAYYLARGARRADVERVFGDGGNDIYMLPAIANPLAIMSEADFASAIKANDSRISSISIYEDIWNLGLTSVLNSNDAYDKKQSYAVMNNAANTKYVVTDAGLIYNYTYGENAAKTSAVNAIKSAVKTYGAVSFGSWWDENNCADVNVSGPQDSDGRYHLNFTVIDRGLDSGGNPICDLTTGHQMTIVGWDDSWEYLDNGVPKTGAFIVQNSWGDAIQTVSVEGIGSVGVRLYTYLSYNSALDVVVVDSVEKTSTYDNVYSVSDYKDSSITPGSNELVFELHSNGSEKVKEITAMVLTGGNHEVYLSGADLRRGATFTSIGQFELHAGINRIVIPDNVVVNGDFVVKLVASGTIDSAERLVDYVNVFTDNDTGGSTQTFTLTLNANGGTFPSGATTTVTCTTAAGGTSCNTTVPNTTPTKSGKVFKGWADSATATAKQYSAGDSITLTANKTIYAVYENAPTSTFTLTLNANGGTFPSGATTTVTCTTAA